MMKIKSLVYVILLVFVVASCDNKEDDTVQIDQGLANEASLVVEAGKALRGQPIALNLIDIADIDQTSEATFYVNDEPIEGNIFSSNMEGMYTVKATYLLNGEETTTEISNVEVYVPKRKILLEGFTGTWCGYCPRKKLAINALRALTEHVAVVSIHGNSASGNGIDPFTIEEGTFLKSHLGIPGFPTGVMNRDTFWDVNPAQVASQSFVDLAGEAIPVSIAIKSSLFGANLSVTASVISETAIDNLKIVVYLIEDGILHDQASYYDGDPNSPYYQQGNPLVNYEHNEVLREILTDPLGDTVGALDAFVASEMTFTTAIPSEFNRDKLSVVVALFDENGVAVNAQFAPVNEEKNFE